MQCCSHQCYFRPTNSSAFQCMVTIIFNYKRHFLLPITAQLEAAPNPRAACCSTACLQHTTEPCRLSYQFPTEVSVLLGTLLLSGGLQWPSSASHHCPQHSSFGGNSLLTGAHKGSSSFWKQAAQEEMRATTNCSFTRKSKIQSQPGRPVSHKHKEKKHFGGILSDWDETDWPTGYTMIALFGVLPRGRMEPEVVFKLWTFIILASFQPCCKGGLCAVACWKNFLSFAVPMELEWGRLSCYHSTPHPAAVTYHPK